LDGAIAVLEARARIDELIVPIAETESAALRAALGRTLAHEVVSPIDVPAYDNAAMDGYALRGDDLATTGPTTLTLAGSALAGRTFTPYVASGSCVRVTTGAVLPEPCDTVVMQEYCRLEGAMVIVEAGQKPLENRRRRGEDLGAGQAALPAGRVLVPADLGLLASLGIAQVSVHRRARVAFFTTGDELRSLGETLDPGSVYDSNRYTLSGMLERLGVEVIDLGVVRDRLEDVSQALVRAARGADAVLSSGGISQGEADYTRRAVEAMGSISFASVAVKPGRPMAAGVLHCEGRQVPFFGLPGNPVAVMVMFYVFVRDALLRLSGARSAPIPLLCATSDSALRKGRARTEYLRGVVYPGPQGWRVRTTGAQGSGILRSMSEANCLIVLEHERGDVAAGEVVNALPLYGLV
jgi:molybdopterin molybdotransferase